MIAYHFFGVLGISNITSNILRLAQNKDAITITATSGLTTGSLNPIAFISDIEPLKEPYASSELRLHLNCSDPARVSSEVLSCWESK